MISYVNEQTRSSVQHFQIPFYKASGKLIIFSMCISFMILLIIFVICETKLEYVELTDNKISICSYHYQSRKSILKSLITKKENNENKEYSWQDLRRVKIELYFTKGGGGHQGLYTFYVMQFSFIFQDGFEFIIDMGKSVEENPKMAYQILRNKNIDIQASDEVIDFFVENTFEVKVSLDGPEYVQNLNRRDYAGTGSFEKIMKNLPLLRKYEQETGNQISVASVVTSNNYQYYAESFQFLLDLGIKKLESGIDYYCSWSDEQIQGLREQIEKVFGLYKAHIQKNQEVIFWNLWEQYLKSFLIPCPFYACKAGLTTCYVTTDGGIYTCAELPEFKIGSVEAGLDVPRIREIIYLEDQEDTMCKKCQYIRHCKTRGCQVANYEIHQNVYQPIKVNCEVTKWMYHLIQTNLTEKQLEKLKQEYERRYLRHGK